MRSESRCRYVTWLRSKFAPAIILFSCVSAFVSRTSLADFSVIHSFGADNDSPTALTITPTGEIVGATEGGTSNSYGTLFTMDQSGSNFQIIHTFMGGSADGALPGYLLDYNSVLYGITNGYGTGNVGSVLFSSGLNGSNYQVLHVFGGNPVGSGILGTVITDGTSLYGTTYTSQSGSGTIYKVNMDGSNYTVLHTFPSSNPPLSGTAIVQSRLFGVTEGNGSSNLGSLYSLNEDGSGFQTVHSFAGGSSDGAVPEGIPLQLGSKLYGTTLEGGQYNHGTIYSVNLDGSGYQLLHSFQVSEGYQIETGLTTDGTKLYGVATLGGAGSLDGTVYSIQPDGSNFEVLRELYGNDGTQPSETPTYYQGTLYDTTLLDGDNGGGTVFAVSVPEPAPLSFVLLPLVILTRRRNAPRQLLVRALAAGK